MSEVRYRNLLVEAPSAAPSPSTWLRLEARLKTMLPESLKQFWANAAGWELPYSVFLPDERSGQPYAFYLEQPSRLGEELASFEDAWFRDRLPRKMLPLGRTGGEDDTLLLDLDPPNAGRLLAWISARPEWAGGPTEDALHIVAGSFDGYLQRLVLLESDISDELADPALRNALADCTTIDTITSTTGIEWGKVLRLRPA